MPRQESPRTRALQPMPSHQQPIRPQTTAKMGPFKGRLLRPGEEFDVNNKLIQNPETTPVIKKMDPRAKILGPGDEEYQDESPYGVTSGAELLSKFSPILPSIGDVGGASKAVAFGAPSREAIKFLKKRGLQNVEEVRRGGLKTYSMGRDIGFSPTHATPEVENALHVAQQRWPRLFGHLNSITDVDAAQKVEALLEGKKAHGGLIPSSADYKLAKLEIDPEAAPETVGHELIHMKDKILDPDLMTKYEAEMRKHGYTSPDFTYEQRARNYQNRFRQILDEVARQGGRPRDIRGRNIRVRPVGTPGSTALTPPKISGNPRKTLTGEEIKTLDQPETMGVKPKPEDEEPPHVFRGKPIWRMK